MPTNKYVPFTDYKGLRLTPDFGHAIYINFKRIADLLEGIQVGDIAAILEEITKMGRHIYNRERWLGISDDQGGSDWADDTLTPFQAISGSNAYGIDTDDAAKVLGTGDTPAIAGMTQFDLRRLFIVNTSVNSPWKLRIIYGAGTMADAITAGQYSELIVMNDSVDPQHSAGLPIDLIMPRGTAGTTQIWIQVWNSTNNATIEFLVGLHEYTA